MNEAENNPIVQAILGEYGVVFDDVFITESSLDTTIYETRNISSATYLGVLYKLEEAGIVAHSVIYQTADGRWSYAVGNSDLSPLT